MLQNTSVILWNNKGPPHSHLIRTHTHNVKSARDNMVYLPCTGGRRDAENVRSHNNIFALHNWASSSKIALSERQCVQE